MLHRIQERKITIEYVPTNMHTTRYFSIRGLLGASDTTGFSERIVSNVYHYHSSATVGFIILTTVIMP